MKENSDYFSHDYYARTDKKLQRVLMKETVTGIGIYWCLVEMLYEEKGYLMRSEYDCYAFALRTDTECLKRIVENYELFKFDDEKFWSESILSRLKIREDKSLKAAESARLRWSEDANAMRTHTSRNANKVNKNKDLFTLQEQEQKSDTPPLGGGDTDFLTKRKAYYTDLLEKQAKNPSIKGYKSTVEYMILNNSPLLHLETLTIEQFSKLNLLVYKAKDLGLWEVLPKFDKKSFEFKQHKDAFTALKCFIDKYYPQND